MYLWSTLIEYIQLLNRLFFVGVVLFGICWIGAWPTQRRWCFFAPILLAGFALLEFGYGIFYYQVTTTPPFFKPVPIHSLALCASGIMGLLCLWWGIVRAQQHHRYGFSGLWLGIGMLIANHMALTLDCPIC